MFPGSSHVERGFVCYLWCVVGRALYSAATTVWYRTAEVKRRSRRVEPFSSCCVPSFSRLGYTYLPSDGSFNLLCEDSDGDVLNSIAQRRGYLSTSPAPGDPDVESRHRAEVGDSARLKLLPLKMQVSFWRDPRAFVTNFCSRLCCSLQTVAYYSSAFIYKRY